MEGRKRKGRFRSSIKRVAMECLCSGEQLKGADGTIRSSDSTITKDFSVSGYSSRNGEIEQYLENGNIEEAELSLREGVSLNSEVGVSIFEASFDLTLVTAEKHFEYDC
jgi:tetratricopeptide repeat protein 7